LKPHALCALLIALCFSTPPHVAARQRARRPAQKSPTTVTAQGVPALPHLPPNTQWPEKVKGDAEKALKNYANDQVSAYLTFREMLGAKNNELKDEQKKWITDALVVLKPRVLVVLNRDLKGARASLDFRGAYIAQLTLLTVAESDAEVAAFLTSLPKLADLMKESFRRTPSPVWEITGATGELMPSYTDGNWPSQTRVSPNKDGYRILRVKAHVRNISPKSDPTYTPWALTAPKRILLMDTRDEVKKPNRLAGDSFINVVTPDNSQSFPCSYVTKKNEVLRDSMMGLIGELLGGAGGDAADAGNIIAQTHPGSFVARGTKFEIDVLFPVPENLNAFRLVIVGSPPVPIRISGK